MATTSTTNLNFTKPDIGSEANNWGNLLNSNFDELDKAIAQRLVKSVSGSSDVSLTDSESRFAVIELTGTLTGNISVKTFNDSSRPYIVFNNTSGSFTLTFSTSTGTGVLINQTQKAIVYSDGTNMVSAVSTDNFATAKTITISGDTTGSVSTDFSTNPTITTAIASGVIVDADIKSDAAIDATKIANGNISNTEFQYLDNLTGEIQTQLNGKAASNVTNSLSASNLDSGTIPNARFPATLPSANGSNLTSLNASNISSGTLSSDRIGGNLITGSGSPSFYAQRAWVRFDGNSSNSIYGSQNVSSITDHAVGKYTVNFATAMPNDDYGVIVTPSSQANYFAVDINGWIDSSGSLSNNAAKNATAPTTNAVRVAIFTDYSLAWRDTDNIVVSVFGV